MQEPLGRRQGVVIFIELCAGQMTSGILYIDLRISFLKTCQKDNHLCDKGSDNHADIRNSGRKQECPRWEREEEKQGSFCWFSKGCICTKGQIYPVSQERNKVKVTWRLISAACEEGLSNHSVSKKVKMNDKQ